MTAAPSWSSMSFSFRSCAKKSNCTLPSAPTWRLGRSPSCLPSATRTPCFFLAGLRWPPAVANAASHLPVSWMWMACSPGGMPENAPFTNMPWGVSVSVTSPHDRPFWSFTSARTVEGASASAKSEPARQRTAADSSARVFIQDASFSALQSRHGIRRRLRFVGQRDEFLVVENRELHAPRAPVALGLLDAIPRRGHEVPFDEALTQRLSTQ